MPKYSKSKTKCVYFCGRKKLEKPVALELYGRELPWVKTANHLGNELAEDGTMDTDTKGKTASFITRSLEIREQFSFAHPKEVLNAVRVYCCDHYGSMLWDLGGNMAKQYFTAWKTCIKLAWGVSRATHTFFLDFLSGGLVSVRRDVLGRYVGFFRSLLASPCSEVNILARIVTHDIRSTTARNLRMVESETGGLTWATPTTRVKEELRSREPGVPTGDAWRLPYLARLIEERDTLVYRGEEDTQEVNRLQELIDSLCSS